MWSKMITFVSEMFRIIAIMFVGAVLGFLLRRTPVVGWLSRLTMATIVLLLFLMGIEIGGNEQIVKNLSSLGVEAVMIAVAATLGSITAARVIYKVLLKSKPLTDEE